MARDPYNRLAYCRALKRLGFIRDGRDDDPLIYKKQVGARLIDLQLWKDGKHRVSHMLDGRGSTPPTEFRTVAEMHRAIWRELERTDHKPFGDVRDIPDTDLLRRAVENARDRRKPRYTPHPRWTAVMDAFALGSTYAAQLCRRFGLDPDEMVKR